MYPNFFSRHLHPWLCSFGGILFHAFVSCVFYTDKSPPENYLKWKGEDATSGKETRTLSGILSQFEMHSYLTFWDFESTYTYRWNSKLCEHFKIEFVDSFYCWNGKSRKQTFSHFHSFGQQIPELTISPFGKEK